MACCVFVAFLVSRLARGVAKLFQPLIRLGHSAPAQPVVVSSNGARFVRSR